MSLDKLYEAKELLNGAHWMAHFVSYPQRLFHLEQLRGEEGEAIADLVIHLAKAIEATPVTYTTNFIDTPNKVVHLHYFGKGVDAWIVERDIGDTQEGTGKGEQTQAYGKISLQGEGWDGAEWGYIDIATMIRLGVEIDLYWSPSTVREVDSLVKEAKACH